MKKHIGFTGTQKGMTEGQKEELAQLISFHQPQYFHHGDCIGADEEAHEIASILGVDIVIHPPINPKKRAFCVGYALMVRESEYLERNHDIVNATTLLIAAPNGIQEKTRSGTWSTVRYARRKGKEVKIIYP